MSQICENIKRIKENIPENVTLVAVSKTKPVSDIETAYDCGQRHFGENKVQELVSKYEVLPKDIKWHMIGHLQRNKVKYIAPFVYLIHGVDNLKLLKEINKQAQKNNRVQSILLQIKIAQEDTKFGMDEDAFKNIIEQYQQQNFPHIKIVGLMGMATNTTDEQQINKEFAYLHQLFIDTQRILPEFKYLSMGMSNDYPIAIQNGSNVIRVGSAIFGQRNYSI
jgi:pyridoxal phosphate enzyme (YggS family)